MTDPSPNVPIVQFPFSGGIDEASRDELVDPGNGWLVLSNGRQDHRGGYSTRKGFDVVPSTRLDATTATEAYKLFADGRSMVRITETAMAEAYSLKAGAWVPAGRVAEVDYRTVDLPSATTRSSPEDVEYCNGYLVVSINAVAGTAALVTVLDATTFSVVRPAEAIVTGNYLRTFLASFSGRYVIATYGAPDAGTIDLYILDTVSAASVEAGWVFLASTVATYLTGDFAVQSLADRIALAYVNTSVGASRVTVDTYDETGLLETAAVNTSSVTPSAVDVRAFPSGTLWVAWNEGTAVKMRGLTSTSLATVLATTDTVITTLAATTLLSISPDSATAGRLIVNESNDPGWGLYMRGYQTSAGAAAPDGTQITVYGVSHCSRPFFYGSRHYVLAFGASSGTIDAANNTQKTLILVDWTDDATHLRPVVNLVPSLALHAYYGKTKTVAGADPTVLYGLAGVTRSSVGDAGMLVEYDFASLRRWQTAVHGNTTFLSGGVLTAFDGTRVAEVGFLYRPAKPFASVSGAGITGTFRYVAVFEEIDADGNWHVSGVSDPSDPIIAADDTISVSTQPLTVTMRASGLLYASLRVAFYRTLTGGEAPYYRVGVVQNNPGSFTLSYGDTTSDADLAAAHQLYSQPGVPGTAQDRRAPPGLVHVTSYNGMLVGAVGSDVWFSGQCISGEGAWFNPIFQVPVPGEGDITALFVQDGTLIVAKRRELYAINGEPPTDAGAGGLGFPRRLACDVGAISHATCSTALGVFFQSERGFEALTRSLAAEWVGEGVQNTLAAYPIVTSMTVDPRSSTVLIEQSATEAAGRVTGAGRTSVYDLSLRSWQSTDRRTSSAGTADTPAQSGCMVFTGTAWRYAWVGADGVVYTESDSYLDGGAYFIVKQAVSGHVKSAGLQGYQHANKALLLGKKHTPHDVSIAFAYNYSSSYEAPRLYTATQIDALTALIPNMQLGHQLHDEARCEAIRISITDATPSTGESVGTGQSGTWVALAFEMVPQQGAFPLPDEAM